MKQRFRFFQIINRVVSACCAATALVFILPSDGQGEESEAVNPTKEDIIIDNYAPDESQSYPLALLQGHVSETTESIVVVENLSSARNSRISRSPIVSKRFKVLIELVPGENRLTVSAGKKRKDLRLFYRKSSNPYFVRLIYFVDSSGETGIKTPPDWKDSEPQDYASKLRIAGMLWQTATAESFNASRLGRRTFSLEFDSNDNVVVWIQRGQKTADEYLALSEKERFKQIYQEIISGNAGSVFARYFVIVSLSNTGLDHGGLCESVALGGGRVGMLDASTFFSWPQTIESVAGFLTDPSPIPEVYLHDSAYRNARWALTSS
ncbi:MAG: hypothetical protein ACI4QC_05080, partial [Thermoguttaceae bacterium]